ncbi:hypothetical protein ACFVGY_11650 [Streptomyces sp. NPDC127106]|uniref:hypothetical protein n=1 Tax=Streptomyces sp. NPDC127106 TaxID=3345360 RepID=UPI00363CB47D
MRKIPQRQWHTAGRVLAGAVAAVAALCTAGCAGDESPSEAVSKAASAVASAGAEVSAAASRAADTVASASAAAQDKLDQIKGVNAKDAVTLGTPSTDSGGYAVVPVTVDNTDSSAKSFAVQVNFKNDGGNTVDVVVVTVDNVAGKAKGEGTARSTHTLSGKITAETARAVRY